MFLFSVTWVQIWVGVGVCGLVGVVLYRYVLVKDLGSALDCPANAPGFKFDNGIGIGCRCKIHQLHKIQGLTALPWLYRGNWLSICWYRGTLAQPVLKSFFELRTEVNTFMKEGRVALYDLPKSQMADGPSIFSEKDCHFPACRSLVEGGIAFSGDKYVDVIEKLE